MAKLSKKEAQNHIKAGASKVTESDIRRILGKRKEIEEKFSDDGPLARFLADSRLLFAVIHDYITGEYRVIPYWSIAAIVAALLYILNPLDFIPDVIPGIGYLDDAVIVAACLALVEKDLHTYRQWRKNRNAD